MSLKKIPRSKIVKTFLLAIVFSFILFISVNKIMALIAIQTETMDLSGNSTCFAGYVFVNGGCVIPTCQNGALSGSSCVALSPAAPTPGSPWYYIATWPATTICSGDQNNLSCAAIPSSTYTAATFAANTNAPSYAPGATITISVAGAAGDQGNGFNGFSSIVNNVLCLLFGCTAPKGIGVAANFNGVQVAGCQGSGSCSNGAGQTFTAPTTPGVGYQIQLTGCYANAGQCSTSSITFDVVAPAANPQVNVWLGYLNDIRSYIKSIFSNSEKINLVG